MNNRKSGICSTYLQLYDEWLKKNSSFENHGEVRCSWSKQIFELKGFSIDGLFDDEIQIRT